MEWISHTDWSAIYRSYSSSLSPIATHWICTYIASEEFCMKKSVTYHKCPPVCWTGTMIRWLPKVCVSVGGSRVLLWKERTIVWERCHLAFQKTSRRVLEAGTKTSRVFFLCGKKSCPLIQKFELNVILIRIYHLQNYICPQEVNCGKFSCNCKTSSTQII